MENVVIKKMPQEPKGCRWIEGDPRDPNWHYCQARIEKSGGSWCPEHEARVFGWVTDEAQAA